MPPDSDEEPIVIEDDAMKPVRLRLIDNKGSVVGHWFLRWDDEAGKWSLSEWLPSSLGVVREEAKQGTDPLEASKLMVSRLLFLCEARYTSYLDTKAALLQPTLHVVPGFRPGYAEKEAKKRLQALESKFSNFVTSYERAIPEELEKVFKSGWPRIELPKFPWRLESPPSATPVVEEKTHAP